MKTLFALLSVSFLLFSGDSYALKLKQKKWKKAYSKEVAKSEADIKKGCGCDKKFEVNWDVKYKHDAKAIASCSESVERSMLYLCREYKAEVCAGVKKLVIKGISGEGKTVRKPPFKNGTLFCLYKFAEKPDQSEYWYSGYNELTKVMEENL